MKTTKSWRIVSLVCSVIVVALGIASFFLCRWIANVGQNVETPENPVGIIAIAFAMAIIAAILMVLSIVFVVCALVPMIIKIVQVCTERDGLSYATIIFNAAFVIVMGVVTISSVLDSTFNWLFFALGLFGMLVSIFAVVCDVLLIVSFHRERRMSVTHVTLEDDQTDR